MRRSQLQQLLERLYQQILRWSLEAKRIEKPSFFICLYSQYRKGRLIFLLKGDFIMQNNQDFEELTEAELHADEYREEYYREKYKYIRARRAYEDEHPWNQSDFL